MNALPPTSSVYQCTVTHARRTPVHSRFRHSVAWYLIDLDELPRLERDLAPIFGVDAGRRRFVTLDTMRHLITEEGASPRERLANCLTRLGVPEITLGRVLLFTNLGVAGYTFAPVSLWFCHDTDDALQAIVVEVNNTYGEQHPYVLRAADRDGSGRWRARFTKQFHVSPFHDLDMDYDIDILPPTPSGDAPRGEPIRLIVRASYRDGRPPFTAAIMGTREPLTRRALLRMQLRYPLLPQRVIALIHLHALGLWLKRVRFHRKPPWQAQVGSTPEIARTGDD